VHGAGSFGHFQATKYGINKGNTYHKKWLEGFADTRRSVTKLNHELVTELINHNVPAVSISLFPNTVTCHKVIQTSNSFSKVNDVMDLGMVPVYHGDVVFDSAQGCAIVSGDVILEQLCETLNPTRAVFLTDVQGIFTRPPTDSNAKLIKELIVCEDGTCMLPEMSNMDHDVTGGIEGKIKTACSIVNRFKIPVFIVQVGTEHAYHAMSGQIPTVCTRLTHISMVNDENREK